MSFMVRDNNRAGMWMYAANHDDFLALQDPQPYGQEVEAYKKHVESTFYGFKYEEPTPTQFQEAHKKWRRILEERNERIRELELALKEKEAAKTIKWNLHKVVIEELESQIKQLKSNSLSGKLKEEVDKLRKSNQEKDTEIQELRDQVTQQAQKWLVPNF